MDYDDVNVMNIDSDTPTSWESLIALDKGFQEKSHVADVVDEHSTLRRHMASKHKGIYRRWCKTSGFLSMLPEDAKARRLEALEKVMEQTQVDDHFHPMKPEDKPTPYSDN
ncbi:hypothetical protein JOM56_007374 [Amanita muscaria]